MDVNKSHRKRCNYADYVAEFGKEYAQDKLFDTVPGRQHSAFTCKSMRIIDSTPMQHLQDSNQQIDNNPFLFHSITLS